MINNDCDKTEINSLKTVNTYTLIMARIVQVTSAKINVVTFVSNG